MAVEAGPSCASRLFSPKGPTRSLPPPLTPQRRRGDGSRTSGTDRGKGKKRQIIAYARDTIYREGKDAVTALTRHISQQRWRGYRDIRYQDRGKLRELSNPRDDPPDAEPGQLAANDNIIAGSNFGIIETRSAGRGGYRSRI